MLPEERFLSRLDSMPANHGITPYTFSALFIERDGLVNKTTLIGANIAANGRDRRTDQSPSTSAR